MRDIQPVLATLSTRSLSALYRIAKKRRGGVRMFFIDPRDMIALRNELNKRTA
jgi:hypothetical protein